MKIKKKLIKCLLHTFLIKKKSKNITFENTLVKHYLCIIIKIFDIYIQLYNNYYEK